MELFNKPPEDWKDLQKKVGYILKGIGFEVEVEKDIQTVRGEVNIDVFAIKQEHIPPEITIVECKFWTSAIPKHVVHSVRTIVSDFGANAGYIISKAGFQAGAVEAAKFTNVYLMSFDEFQHNFKRRYLEAMTTELERVRYPLWKYTDVTEDFISDALKMLSSAQHEKYVELRNDAMIVSMMASRMNYRDMRTGELDSNDDIEYVVNKYSSSNPEFVKGDCLINFFKPLLEVNKRLLQQMDDLFGKPLRKDMNG